MELHRVDFSSAWVQTLPPLVGFIVSLYKKDCVKYRDSVICGWIAHRGLLSPAFYLLPLQHLTACLGQVTSFCSAFKPPPILYQHQV